MYDGRDLFHAHGSQPPYGTDPIPMPIPMPMSLPGHVPFTAADRDVLDGRWDAEAALMALLETSASASETADDETRPQPVVEAAGGPSRVPGSHRRRREPTPKSRRSGAQRLSYLIVALTCLVVAAVSVLGGAISLDPLSRVAPPDMAPELAWSWPVLVHGPWVVASLSILRACVHYRRAMHSWAVVLVFAALSMVLSVANAPKTIQGVVVAVLPALATLACLQQLVRQITLTRPPRRSVTRRRITPQQHR